MKDKIKTILTHRDIRQIIDPDAVSAAVLIPIFHKNGEDHILFTKRTETVENHKGQVSFPGGRYEEEDGDLLHTALRESQEEIGLDPDAVEVLGQLEQEKTYVTNFIITPYVGFIPYPYPFRINTNEVEKLIEVPISSLADRKRWHEDTEFYGAISYKAYSFYHNDDIIWGATARILKRFFTVVCSKL